MTSAATPINRILLPTDLSEFSSLALRHALALARRFKARLKVVYVLPRIAPVGGEIFVGATWAAPAEMWKKAEDDVHSFMSSAREARIDYEVEILEGDPWREILAAAEEMPADLVVMGTHGRSGPERFVLGSVAEKLVRRLPCPVLTVGHEEGRTWEAPGLVSRILCATDFSETSHHAFAHALALAASHGARITLLHSVEYMPDLGEARYRPVVPDPDPLRREIERGAAERLERAIEGRAPEFRNVAVTPRLAVGRAYKEILRVAAEESADLIVIGAQSHGLVDHLLSGSNAQHVIRRASCPVLTVRPRRPKAVAAADRPGAVLAKPLETEFGRKDISAVGKEPSKLENTMKAEVEVATPSTLFEEMLERHEMVARRAFELFESHAGFMNSEIDDWLAAERELFPRPDISLRQDNGRFEIEAALPGVDAKKIDVKVTGEDIVISGEREAGKATSPTAENATVASNGSVRYFASIHLPQNIEAAKVKADYKQGVLHVTAPIAKPKTTSVPVQA